MKRIVILLSSLLILFASCSAEIVETLPKAEVVVLDADVRVNGIGRGSFEVMFKPVPFASGYTYDLNSSGIESSPNPVAYANGYCFIEFNNIEQSEGEITLYAIDDTGETHRIGSSPYSLTLQGVSPDAYFSYRDATSAEITVNPVFADKIIVYRIELFDSNGEIVETRELHDIHDSILLTGLGPYAYELILSHGLEGYEMSDSTTHISIPAYDAASAQVVMELDSDGSGFTVVGIPGDVSRLVLWKSTSDVGNGIPLDVDIEINGGKASIPFTALKSLEEGYFHVKDENGSYASNIYKCTVPLVNPVIEANFKSAFIAYQFAHDFNPADYELTIKGTSDGSSPVGSFEDSDGDGLVDRVFISGLVSNKPYDGLVIELKNRNTLALLSCPLDESFDTKSFEGTYYWNNAGGKPSNFVVDVVVPDCECHVMCDDMLIGKPEDIELYILRPQGTEHVDIPWGTYDAEPSVCIRILCECYYRILQEYVGSIEAEILDIEDKVEVVVEIPSCRYLRNRWHLNIDIELFQRNRIRTGEEVSAERETSITIIEC